MSKKKRIPASKLAVAPKVKAPTVAELRTKLLGDLEAIKKSMENAQQQLNDGAFAKAQTEGALIALQILDGNAASGIVPTDIVAAEDSIDLEDGIKAAKGE